MLPPSTGASLQTEARRATAAAKPPAAAAVPASSIMMPLMMELAAETKLRVGALQSSLHGAQGLGAGTQPGDLGGDLANSIQNLEYLANEYLLRDSGPQHDAVNLPDLTLGPESEFHLDAKRRRLQTLDVLDGPNLVSYAPPQPSGTPTPGPDAMRGPGGGFNTTSWLSNIDSMLWTEDVGAGGGYAGAASLTPLQAYGSLRSSPAPAGPYFSGSKPLMAAPMVQPQTFSMTAVAGPTQQQYYQLYQQQQQAQQQQQYANMMVGKGGGCGCCVVSVAHPTPLPRCTAGLHLQPAALLGRTCWRVARRYRLFVVLFRFSPRQVPLL